jgi:hypothetical protein
MKFAVLVLASIALCSSLAHAQYPRTIWELDGSSAEPGFGASVGSAGDVNLDGYSDILVGISGLNHVRIYSGVDGSILMTVGGPPGTHSFGAHVCGIGDQNGDGIPDFAVSDPNYQRAGMSDVGAVGVFSGISGELLWQDFGDDTGWLWGSEICNAGDLNGDGMDDVLVGNLDDSPFWTGPGYVDVLSGVDGHVLWSLEGKASGQIFGTSIAPAGDVDGDGFEDLMVNGWDNIFTADGYMRVYGGIGADRALGLLTPAVLTAGTASLNWVTGAVPGTTVSIHTGTGLGRSFRNSTLGIENAYLADYVFAGRTGTARLNVYLPPSLAGTPIWIQASNSGEDRLSNIEFRIVH